jgi:hypothetical protein
MSKILKQIFIAVVFFSIIGLAVYFGVIRKEPTCFDGIQNQGEEEIDCGGPCEACPIPPPPVEDLIISWEKIIPSGQNLYDLVAQIKNSNTDYGANLIGYNFKIYDKQNSLLNKKEGKTFILPGETKYIIEPFISSEKADRTVFEISQIDWQRLKVYKEPEIIIKEKIYQNLSGNPYYGEASGIVINKSSYDFDKILINVVLYGGEENVLGAGSVELSTMLSSEERYFNVLWPYPIFGTVSFVEMQAETNVFNSENFMKRHGTTEKFQQYQ